MSSYLVRLFIVLRRLAPQQDYNWLILEARRIFAKAPRLKRPLVYSIQLRRIALEALADGERKGSNSAFIRARRFRNALIVGMLSEAPIRVGSFSMLQLGDLVKVDKAWQIYVEAEHAKRRKASEYQLSEEMSRYLEIYLSEMRPLFRDAVICNALWLSQTGGMLTASGIARVIQDYTQARLGLRLSPHSFRRAAAAFIAYADPENILVVRDLLGHEDFRVTQRHYLPAARSRRAGRFYAEVIGVPVPYSSSSIKGHFE